MYRASEYGLMMTVTNKEGLVEKKIILGEKHPVTLPYACKKMKECAELYENEACALIDWPTMPLSWTEYLSTVPGIVPKVEWSIVNAENINGDVKIDWERWLSV